MLYGRCSVCATVTGQFSTKFPCLHLLRAKKSEAQNTITCVAMSFIILYLIGIKCQ